MFVKHLQVPRKDRQERLFNRAMMASRRVVFALSSQTKAQARIIPRTEVEERTKKEKARKEPKDIWPCLGIRRLVCQLLDWRFLDFRCWVVLHKGLYCIG